jgi:Helicase conserved C-terminal domain
MTRSSGLSAWLVSLRPEQLLALLRRRPDVARAPEPRDLAELAGRLNGQHSIPQAVEQLSLPALEVAEAVLSVGGSATRDTVLGLLGVTDEATATRVDQALDELLGLALVWPAGASVRMSGAWAQVLPDPLALGRSGQVLYNLLTIAQLARIGSGLGLGGFERKRDWVDAITAAVADPAAVARRLAQAPPALADIVEKLAWHGPRIGGVRFPDGIHRIQPEQLGMLLAVQGWVVPTEWGRGEMPRELALAVRGPDYRAPFTAEPPTPATAAIDPRRLTEAGRHAAGAAVEAVRRMAKQLSIGEPAVRLWLEVAAGAGLVAATRDAVIASTDADGWLTADPARALATLLLAWWQLPTVPGHRVDDIGKALPALAYSFNSGAAAAVRAAALAELAALDSARGLVDVDGLAAALRYRRPLSGDADCAVRLRTTLDEAALLGLASDGALTPLGHALLAAAPTSDPAAALITAATGMLPEHTRTATFLPDLTAIVAGGAAVQLSRLLDEVAETERRDVASSWRFTPGSVRAALDAGRTADELLDELAAVADNPLPQPLTYLVRDVARRHGQLQVFAVASCVRVADAALGAEVAAHRGLAALRLRVLSDTVLASSMSVEKTVAALRAAGYAPVRQDGKGETVVERVPVRRAEPRRAGDRRTTIEAGPDLAALARRLSWQLTLPGTDPHRTDAG